MSQENEKLHREATLEDVLDAVSSLSNEVLAVRQKLEPITMKQRVFIIVVSSFMGGVFTNLVLYLLGAGTILGLR